MVKKLYLLFGKFFTVQAIAFLSVCPSHAGIASKRMNV